MHIRLNNNNVSDLTIKILIASFLAQVMVVGVHHLWAIKNDFLQLGYTFDKFHATSVFSEIGSNVFRLSPYIFFIISGFLFFRNFQKENSYKRKVLSRIRSLGTPYVIWNIIASPWFTAFLIPVFAIFMPWLGEAREMSVKEVFLGNSPGYYPANAPLWFIRELLLVVLISPIIWRLINSKFIYMYIAASYALWIYAANYQWGGVENLTQALFGFSLGGYLQVISRSPFSISKRMGIAAFILYIFFVVVEFCFDFTLNIMIGLECIVFCIATFAFADYLSKTRLAYLLAWLGEAAIFIYLTHMIGRGEFAKLVISIINPQNDVAALLTVILIWALIIGYTVGFWAILRKIAPGILGFLTGGRVRNLFSVKFKSNNVSDLVKNEPPTIS